MEDGPPGKNNKPMIFYNKNGGVAGKVWSKLAGKYLEKKYYEDFFKGASYPAPNNSRILLYVGIGHMYLTPIEILMYHMLRKKGYTVDYFIYDEHVEANEVITKNVIEEQGKEKFWSDSVRNAKRILEAAGIPYQFITRTKGIDQQIAHLKNDLQAILAYQYEGVDFGDIVKGVLFRYYKSISFGDDAPSIAFGFLQTALTNYEQVKRLQEANRYDAFYFSHGIYCTWQPVAAYCEANHIRYICYDRAKRSGSLNFNINQPSPDWSFPQAWERYAAKELTESEERKVSEYLGERELQKGDVYSYNTSVKATDISALKKQLGIPEGRKVITIFTNLIWDAANVSRDIAFNSALDCILTTIRRYEGNNDIQVVVRAHPAEKVLGTKERYGSLVRSAFQQHLPDNVTIIEPEMDVNSFSVIEMSDIGVVNTSTVGLEFAMLGKPIILISETNYRGKGFTYDATSTEHYFEIMAHLLQTGSLLPQQVKLSRKYFYMMMFLYQQPMPAVFEGNYFLRYSYTHFNQIPESDYLYQLLEIGGDADATDFVRWR
jgi:hypothetical protein